MATQQDLLRERELLTGLGLKPVKGSPDARGTTQTAASMVICRVIHTQGCCTWAEGLDLG